MKEKSISQMEVTGNLGAIQGFMGKVKQEYPSLEIMLSDPGRVDGHLPRFIVRCKVWSEDAHSELRSLFGWVGELQRHSRFQCNMERIELDWKAGVSEFVGWLGFTLYPQADCTQWNHRRAIQDLLVLTKHLERRHPDWEPPYED